MDISIESVFWTAAIGGSLFFLLRTFLMFFGPVVDLSHDSFDQDFKIFSIYTLTGFFMMFGWFGLAGVYQFGFSIALALFSASIAGLFMILVVRFIFQGVKKLVSAGGKYILEEVIGKTGTVHQQISSKKTGKVQVVLGGMIREVPALSVKGEIASFTKVKILRADGDLLIVEKLRG